MNYSENVGTILRLHKFQVAAVVLLKTLSFLLFVVHQEKTLLSSIKKLVNVQVRFT